jgi:hypothetical protein
MLPRPFALALAAACTLGGGHAFLTGVHDGERVPRLVVLGKRGG